MWGSMPDLYDRRKWDLVEELGAGRTALKEKRHEEV